MTGALLRFGLGWTCGVLAGLAAFRGSIFVRDTPAFECVIVAALLAGVLTLVRIARCREALALAGLYGGARFAVADADRWREGAFALVLGLGVVLVALVFDDLGSQGFRIGKFLIVGPLLAGVFLALAPIQLFQSLSVFDPARPLLFQMFLGIVTGDGVALGVELAELVPERDLREVGG